MKNVEKNELYNVIVSEIWKHVNRLDKKDYRNNKIAIRMLYMGNIVGHPIF